MSAALMISLRPAGAQIPVTDANVRTLANVADSLNELLAARGYEPLTDEQRAALWCADAADTFGMLDDFESRLGLDASDVKVVADALASLIPNDDLRVAMIELHDKLAEIELDIAEEGVVRDRTPHPGRQVIAEQVIPMWWRQHEKLVQFFDLDVYLGRVPVSEAA